MINLKKHTGLLVAAVIVALLLVAAGVMVFYNARLYSSESDAYHDALARFNELCQRDPFPSDTNVAVELDNVARLTNKVDRLFQELRKGQVAAKNMAPEAFIAYIQTMARNLSRRMSEAGVLLPAPNFDFDFDKYVSKGIPPDPSHIAGLNYQFELVNIICGIMADAKIAELKSVRRDSFDAAPAPDAPVSRRGRSSPAPSEQPPPSASASGASPTVSIDAVPPGDLFSKIHFSFSFVGTEDSIWTVLNHMAAARVFIVVTRVKLTNPRAISAALALETPLPGAASGSPEQEKTPEAAEAEARILPRAERIVVGNELVEAEVELDVYRFASPESLNAGPGERNKR